MGTVVGKSPGTEGALVVPAIRLAHSGAGEELCAVVVEDMLTVKVEGVGTYTLMWTPPSTADEPVAYTAEDGLLGDGEPSERLMLAVGFLFTEGLIGGLADIRTMTFCPDNPRVVSVVLRNPTAADARRRDVVINSSCGVCGEGHGVVELAARLPALGTGLSIASNVLQRMMVDMRSRQAVFEATGGAHAAAVFAPHGQIVAAAEDLGRHNALDKVIGRCLLESIDTAGCGVLLSSRLSLEMVAKAVRARFQIVAAISAPTTLAIELATRKGLTLCGFVREGRCTVYSCRHRISDCEMLGMPRLDTAGRSHLT